jgi:hypothetical protein
MTTCTLYVFICCVTITAISNDPSGPPAAPARSLSLSFESAAGIPATVLLTLVAMPRALSDAADGRTTGTPLLSSAARTILQTGDLQHPLYPAALRALKLSDKPELLRQFRRLPLSERVSVTWALAYLGGADVRDAFVEALQSGYRHGSMTGGEIQGLAGILNALGVLASDDDVAFAFLREHAAPEQWGKVRKWRDHDVTWDQDAVLAGGCVRGLGLSGRPEAQVLLDEMVRWEWSTLKRIWPGVIDGQFGLWMRRQEPDPKEFMIAFISGGLEKMGEWYRTQQGGFWRQWGRQQTEALRLESQSSPRNDK